MVDEGCGMMSDSRLIEDYWMIRLCELAEICNGIVRGFLFSERQFDGDGRSSLDFVFESLLRAGNSRGTGKSGNLTNLHIFV